MQTFHSKKIQRLFTQALSLVFILGIFFAPLADTASANQIPQVRSPLGASTLGDFVWHDQDAVALQNSVKGAGFGR
jgi:hypothetical protein